MEGSKEYLIKLKEQEFIELFGDMDENSEASYETHNYIESLLLSSQIPEQREREIYQNLQIGGFTNLEAVEVIEYLKENQIDRVQAGFNYFATDILRKFNKDGGDT